MLHSRNLTSKVLPLAIVMVLAAVLLPGLTVQAEDGERQQVVDAEPVETAQVEQEEAVAPLMTPVSVEDVLPGQLTAPEPEWMVEPGLPTSSPCAPDENFCCLDEWQGYCPLGQRVALCTFSEDGTDICNTSKATGDFFCVEECALCFQ